MATAPAAAVSPSYTVVPLGCDYAVHKSGAPLQTPGRATFVLPTSALAEAIAQEWAAPTDKVRISMPMTQLAATAIDITRKDRAGTLVQVQGYVASELLCYHAENPPQLVADQLKHWQPALDWLGRAFGIVLRTGPGVMPIEQGPEVFSAMRTVLHRLDDFRLTGLKFATEVSGSLVLALALAEGFYTPQQVFEAAEIDSSFQAQIWGQDPASEKRRESIQYDLVVSELWFDLLKA
ncbi:MAG: ATPase [Pseudomonadota bacterium]|nr:ATPase [Pseudomonadota bacterium]